MNTNTKTFSTPMHFNKMHILYNSIIFTTMHLRNIRGDT